MKLTASYPISLLFAAAWFIVSFFASSIVSIFLYNKTMATWAFISIFAIPQFFVGALFGLVVGRFFAKCYLRVALWMMFFVLLERAFLDSYLIVVVDFTVILSIFGDVLAGLMGFFLGSYLTMKWGRSPIDCNHAKKNE